MIDLRLNNIQVCLPEKFNIKIKQENLFFSKSSKYTLSIDIPILPNYSICGNINRIDVANKVVSYDAILYANNKLIMHGTAVVVSANSEKMAIQLLSGNSELNFISRTESLYIDELKLMFEDQYNDKLYYYNYIVYTDKEERYRLCWGQYPTTNCVAFPIRNVNSDTVLNDYKYYMNRRELNIYDSFTINMDHCGMATQPYLCYIIKRIFRQLGFEINNNEIEKSIYKDIFIINSTETNVDFSADNRPTYYDFMLPHWTVSQFMTEVENLLNVIFIINENNKTVDIQFRDNYCKKNAEINEILDEYDIEILQNTDVEENIGYNFESSDSYDCLPDEIINVALFKEFETLSAMNEFFNSLICDENNSMYAYSYIYCYNEQQYICFSEPKPHLVEVNQLRARRANPSNKDLDIELKIVPAQLEIGTAKCIIDNTNITQPIEWDGQILRLTHEGNIIAEEKAICNLERLIKKEEEVNEKKEPAKKDLLEVAFNDGIMQRMWNLDKTKNVEYPFPVVLSSKNYKIPQSYRDFSFELNDTGRNNLFRKDRLKLQKKMKTHIKFTDDIMSPNEIFLINNKKYLCESMEIELTQNGIEDVKSGYFYQILE